MKYLFLMTIVLSSIPLSSAGLFEVSQNARDRFTNSFGHLKIKLNNHSLTQKEVKALLVSPAPYVDWSVIQRFLNENKDSILSTAESVMQKGAKATPAEIENAIASLRIITEAPVSRENVETYNKANRYIEQLEKPMEKPKLPKAPLNRPLPVPPIKK